MWSSPVSWRNLQSVCTDESIAQVPHLLSSNNTSKGSEYLTRGFICINTQGSQRISEVRIAGTPISEMGKWSADILCNMLVDMQEHRGPDACTRTILDPLLWGWLEVTWFGSQWLPGQWGWPPILENPFTSILPASRVAALSVEINDAAADQQIRLWVQVSGNHR